MGQLSCPVLFWGLVKFLVSFGKTEKTIYIKITIEIKKTIKKCRKKKKIKDRKKNILCFMTISIAII